MMKIALGIRESYYHPDDLEALSCGVETDWDALATQLKRSPESRQNEALKQTKIRMKAVRGKAPEVSFAWAGDAAVDHAALEEGMRKALTGFFQVYWALDASSIAPTADEKPVAEAGDDGGYRLRFSAAGARVVEEIDKQFVVRSVRYERPDSTLTMEPRFSEAPNDIPGHPRLLTSVDVSEQPAVHIALDYQEAGGVHVPWHVTFAVAKSYTLPIVFTGCSVSRAGRSGR